MICVPCQKIMVLVPTWFYGCALCGAHQAYVYISKTLFRKNNPDLRNIFVQRVLSVPIVIYSDPPESWSSFQLFWTSCQQAQGVRLSEGPTAKQSLLPGLSIEAEKSNINLTQQWVMLSRYSFVTVLGARGITPPNMHSEEIDDYAFVGIACMYSLHFWEIGYIRIGFLSTC